MDKDSVGDIYDNTEMHPVKSIGPLFPWSPLARSHTQVWPDGEDNALLAREACAEGGGLYL